MPQAFVPSSASIKPFVPEDKGKETAFVPEDTGEATAFVPESRGGVESFVPEDNGEVTAFVPEGGATSEGRDYRRGQRKVFERPFHLQEAEIDGLGTNLMATMAVVDQPRSAIVGAVTELFEQDEFDLASVKEAFELGITGKNHPMLGEYFESKIDHIKANPKDYPIASTILEGLDYAFNIPYKGYSYWADYEQKNTAIAGSLLALVTCGDDKECQKSRIESVVTPLLTSAQQSIEKREKTGTATTALAYGVGFFGDVLLDPITYTNPILKYTKMGLRVMIPNSVMKKMVETTGKTKQQIKTAFLSTNTGQKLSEASDFIWTLFSTKHDLKKLGVEGSQAYDLASKFKNLIAAARVKAVRDNINLQKRIKQFSSDTGVEVSEINKFITEAVERGGIPNVDTRNLSPATIKILAHNDDIRYEVWSLASKNEAQLLAEINASVPLTKMSKQPIINSEGGDTLYLMYMNHAIRPEALKAAKKVQILESGGKSASAFFNSKHSSTFKRRKDWAGLTINDVNDLAKKGTLPGYEGQIFKTGFFYDDPSILQALRDNKHYRSLAASELASDITGPQGFGVAPKLLIKLAKDAGWKASKTKKKLAPDEALKYLQEQNPQEWVNWAITENKYTRNWALPKDVAKFVDNNLLYLKNPQKVNMFLEQYDDLTRWWKSWTLSIFPSYHIRNAVGNTWNNFVVGVNPKTYKEALKFQQAIYRGETGSITIKGIFDKNVLTKSGVGRVHPTTKVSYTQIRDWADEYGVTGRGLFSADIETTLRQEMGEGKWLTLSSKNKAIEIGKRVGEAVEDNARMANFIDGLKKGMTPEAAAKRVRRTLFDYSDLTEFEQKVMKRLFPFYTWTRKNVPFQVRQMIQNPGKYKAIDTLRQEVEAAVGESDENEKYLAEWMLSNYPTKVGVNDKGEAEYFFLGGWWAGADLWKVASQPTKLATDLLHPVLKIGLEMWTGAMDEKGYVTDLFSGQKLHPELQTDYLFGWGDERMTVSETTKHYLNNLRVLSTMDEFIRAWYNEKGEGPQKISPFTKDPRTIEEAMLAFFTGIRTFKVDLENQKLFFMKDIQKETEKFKELAGKSMKKGRPIKETKDLIDKSIAPIKELQGMKHGGYVDESVVDKQMKLLAEQNKRTDLQLPGQSKKDWLDKVKTNTNRSLDATAEMGYAHGGYHPEGGVDFNDLKNQFSQLIENADAWDITKSLGQTYLNTEFEAFEKTDKTLQDAMNLNLGGVINYAVDKNWITEAAGSEMQTKLDGLMEQAYNPEPDPNANELEDEEDDDDYSWQGSTNKATPLGKSILDFFVPTASAGPLPGVNPGSLLTANAKPIDSMKTAKDDSLLSSVVPVTKSSAGKVINSVGNWWNKGKDSPSNLKSLGGPESKAKVFGNKGLLQNDLRQLTRTDASFKAGDKGLKGLNPAKAFTSKMLQTGPSPFVRQAVARAFSRVPVLSALMPGTAGLTQAQEMASIGKNPDGSPIAGWQNPFGMNQFTPYTSVTKSSPYNQNLFGMSRDRGLEETVTKEGRDYRRGKREERAEEVRAKAQVVADAKAKVEAEAKAAKEAEAEQARQTEKEKQRMVESNSFSDTDSGSFDSGGNYSDWGSQESYDDDFGSDSHW